MIGALRQFIGANQMMAYLVMMAARLVELHRVLKPTGSLYLHCDPTASHYLKIVLDTIFGPQNFRNEIIWKRTTAHSDARQGARHRQMTIHSSSTRKSDSYTWNPQYTDRTTKNTSTSKYRSCRGWTGRRYTLDNLTSPKPATEVAIRTMNGMGVTYRRLAGAIHQRTMERVGSRRAHSLQPSPGARARFKRYLDEMQGVPLQDVWDGHSLRSTRRPRNASATPPKSPSPSWSASSRPAATPATWCSTRSAAAAPRSRPRKSWAAAGSASTSPTCRSRCKSTAWQPCSPA